MLAHLRSGQLSETGRDSPACRRATRLVAAALIWLLATAIVSRCISAAGSGLDVVFPGDLDLGTLVVGENVSDMQGLYVYADSGYRVYVRADRERLGQWDRMVMAYVAGSEMAEPLILMTERGRFAVGIGDVLIADRSGPTPSPEIAFRFVQRIGFGDRPASDGRVYRILLTYTVVQDI